MLHSLRDMQSEGIDMRASVTKQSQLLEALMRKVRSLAGSPASPGGGTTSISTSGGVTSSSTSSQSTNEVTKEGFFTTEVNVASKEVACVKQQQEGQIRKRKKKAPIQTTSPGEASFQTTPTLGKRKSSNQNHDVPLYTTTTTSAAQHEFYVATSPPPPLVQDNFPRNTPHFTHSPSPTNSFPQTKYRKYSRPVDEEPPASYHQNYTVSYNRSPTPATMAQPPIPQSNYGVPGPTMRLAGVNELLALDTTGVHLPPLNLPPLHQPVSSNYQLPPPYAQPQQYYQPPPQPTYNYYGTPQPYYHGPHYSYNNYYYK